MDSMAEAHRRYYEDKAKFDVLRAVIHDFLDDPPTRVRVHEESLETLRTIAVELDSLSAYIVRVWD